MLIDCGTVLGAPWIATPTGTQFSHLLVFLHLPIFVGIGLEIPILYHVTTKLRLYTTALCTLSQL